MPQIGKFIGVINQIEDDRNLHFIANNIVKCNIGDIVGLENTNNTIVLALISDIEINYYLENSKMFFISKAVDNEIHKLADPKNKPRYGQYITATILGHYEFSKNDFLIEKVDTVNRYTPSIFQEVYLIPFEKVLDLYSLCPEIKIKDDFIFSQTICLGKLSFPLLSSFQGEIPLHFGTDILKKHTLITGVTGSGKSRFASLLVKELASIGAHISILDPHDEFTDLLASSDKYEIHKICPNVNSNSIKYGKNVKYRTISFYEKNINPNTLTKLLPSLSAQQVEIIYEVFSNFNSDSFDSKNFLNKLMDYLNYELESNYSKSLDKIKQIQSDSEKYFPNHIDFIDRYIRGIKSITERGKVNKTSVLIAIITKINDLRKNQLLSNIEPNWLVKSPYSIDVFNIDYSTNEYVRRFINSIIHYFLREKNKDEFRALLIDEAHMLLNDNTITSNLVKQLLREARKFNLTLIFISQNKMDIPVEIRSQFQNNFRFRESDSEETRFFPDRICEVSLYGSKTNFSMRVNNILGVNEYKARTSNKV
jgi:hypothetical protein